MTSSDYDARFGGIGRLYGVDALHAFRQAHVCVVGVGGVGSWTVEALARTGVGTLTLIDLDEVCINNTNRQLPALDGAVGRAKIEVLAERVALIQPTCAVHCELEFFTAETAGPLLDRGYDVVVDAIDDLRNKALLIAECRKRDIPTVVCGGAGGRRDPTQIQLADLTRSGGDGLLRQLRRTLRKEFDFPADGPWGIPTVFSAEPAVYPTPEGGICTTRSANSPLRLDCSAGFGAATMVTGSFGFAAAAAAVELLTRNPRAQLHGPS